MGSVISNPEPLMSALGHKRTLRTILDASETIVGFNPACKQQGRHRQACKTGGRERDNPRLSASVQCLSARL